MSGKSLAEILDVLKAIDDDMPPEEFDPAVIVGDLKDKIDAVKWRCETWKKDAELLQDEWITKLQARKDAILKKRERLLDYVRREMITHEFKTLPGQMFRVDLQSNKKVQVQGDPTPDLYLKHKDIIRQDVSYRWDKKALKERLDAGDQIPFASLVDEKKVRFYSKKGEK